MARSARRTAKTRVAAIGAGFDAFLHDGDEKFGSVRDVGASEVVVYVENTGNAPALGLKLTLVDHMGTRVLPALYSDNYVNLLPGESRSVEIRYPAGNSRTKVNLRGWNVRPASAKVVPFSGDVAQYNYYQTTPYIPSPSAKSATITIPKK